MDEKIILSKIKDKMTLTQKKDIITYTDFLDLHKVSLIHSLVKNFHIKYSIYGGYEDAERRVVSFYPLFLEEITIEEFPIKSIEIAPIINKFSKYLPTHRDYLGAILGLGISRDKVGDIIINKENKAYVFVKEDIREFIVMNLFTVGKGEVSLREIDDLQSVNIMNNSQVISVTIPSLRLDAIISQGFGLSRTNSSKLISSGKVYVNWIPKESSSLIIKEKDTITVRGYGRVKIKSIDGMTKRGRTHITIEKYA